MKKVTNLLMALILIALLLPTYVFASSNGQTYIATAPNQSFGKYFDFSTFTAANGSAWAYSTNGEGFYYARYVNDYATFPLHDGQNSFELEVYCNATAGSNGSADMYVDSTYIGSVDTAPVAGSCNSVGYRYFGFNSPFTTGAHTVKMIVNANIPYFRIASYGVNPNATPAPTPTPTPAPTPTPTPMPIPTGLNVTGINGAVTATWNAVSAPNLAGYYLYQNGNRTTGTFITGTSQSLAVSTNTSLSYQVTSIDTSGRESAKSAIVSYSSPDTIPPPVPTGLHATSDSSSIHLYWDVVNAPDFAGYRVYRNGALAYTSTYAGLINFNDTSLASGTSYSYQVTAYDTSGNESAKSTALVYATANIKPPTGLTTTAGDAKVTLQWSANTESDLKGYNVYQGSTKLNSSPITGTSYVVAAGLTNATTYSFTVSAVNTTGKESAQSAAVTATPRDITPPAAPTGLTATAGISKVNLQWAANTESDLQGYNVYQGTTKLNSSPITGTSYQAAGLTNATTYSFTISAVDMANNESGKSAAATATPLNTIPPAIPSGVTAKAGDTQIFLNWTADTESDLSGYNIYQGTTKLNSDPITATNYTVKNLTNGTNYSFTISAINISNAESAKSAAANATPIPPPAIPTGLAATAGDTQVTLHWTANTESNLKGYFIFVNGTKINSTPITGTSYTVASGLTNAITYSFAISAIDIDNYQSAPSAAVTATPRDTTPPAIPIGLTGTAGNGGASLQWGANTESDLKGYNIYKDSTKVNGTPITSTSYIVDSLTNGTSYSFAISAVDLLGNESAKSAAVIVIPIAVPAPTGLKAKNDLTAKKIALTWDTPLQFATYIIYRNGTQLATSTTPNYDDTTAIVGNGYTYDVVAVDGSGNKSVKSSIQTYFSKNPIDFGSNTGFSVSDILKSSTGFIGLFVMFILLILAIKFSPQLKMFLFFLLNKLQEYKEVTKNEREKKEVKLKGKRAAEKTIGEKAGKAAKVGSKSRAKTKERLEKVRIREREVRVKERELKKQKVIVERIQKKAAKAHNDNLHEHILKRRKEARAYTPTKFDVTKRAPYRSIRSSK